MSITNGAFPKGGIQADTALRAHSMTAPIAHRTSVQQQSKGFLAASTRPLSVFLAYISCPFPSKLVQLHFQFPNHSGQKGKKGKKSNSASYKLMMTWLHNATASWRCILKCDFIASSIWRQPYTQCTLWFCVILCIFFTIHTATKLQIE